MSPGGKVRAGQGAGLLVKAAFARHLRPRPWLALVTDLALPVAAVAFLTFLHSDATVRGGWPMLAVGGAVWLLFANSVVHGGMVLWHERRLLRDGRTPAWLLVTTATTAPLAVFVVQIAIVEVVLALDADRRAASIGSLVVAAAIAVATGVAAGIVCAQLTTRKPQFVRLLPALLVVSFVVTPVAYRLSALEDASTAWCYVNPLCAAVEGARADVTVEPSAQPDHAALVAAAIALAALALALVSLRRRNGVTQVDEKAATAIALKGVTVLAPGGALVLEVVDLTVAPGEVLTVIGGPDSGTTALLEVCAGVLVPDDGAVEVHGGVTSLLQPGDGFHTALTGRENATLRGRLDGLSPADAKARAERVMGFAELDRVAAAPVARYSEENAVRLGFSAMVLSDARVVIWNDVVLCRHPEFRAKCLAHLPAIVASGRAVVVATDDLGKTELLGRRAVLLDHGTVVIDGDRDDVLARHLAPHVTLAPPDEPGRFTGGTRLVAVQLLDESGAPAAAYLPGDPITIAVELEVQAPVELPYLLLSIADQNGPITAASMFLDGHRPARVEGRYRFECRFDGLVLAPGHRFTVRFAAYASDGTTIVFPKRDIASFVVGGSAASVGFEHERATTRIFGAPPVVSTYSWRLPGDVDEKLGRDPD